MKKVFARTIHSETSPISGSITVKDNGIVRELFVKGIKQTSWSDDPSQFEGTYWKAAVSPPFPMTSKKPQFLVVGLGGGTIPKLLTNKYPNCQIVCLEIDPSIIKIAQDLFNLKDFANIKIIEADANLWITKNKEKYLKHFDAIFLDAFFGESFSFDTQMEMMNKVQTMLKKNGVVITNRIYNEYEEKVNAFIVQLSDIFPEQAMQIIEGFSGNDNIIIFSKNK